ncbi:heavy metal transport/detoxification protein [Echinicola sp. CAU 1574]|uniref:Heavy metal transport/detoxification protein n=1 Tax=Echinicola arenosa TaxID=2774144 RepID=A0ABR9ALP7_9BACT|nr:cation transporter [Echinicola arenosa]MBD8489610.1 heavy metal transport/detoxification protein [Echinicola arenosa]
MIQLKTNIKCEACVATVKPKLDKLPHTKWKVDLTSPDRILTAEGEANVREIISALEDAGYKGEPI